MPSPYGKPTARRANGWNRRDDRRELRPHARKAPPVPFKNWPPATKRWWRAVWTHPVSSEWDEVADFPAVARLGSLYADANGGKALTGAVLAQMTRLEAELLLLPAARKRAYVRLPSLEDEHTTTEPGPDYRAMLETRQKDRRARLTETGVERPDQPHYDAFDGLRLMADGSVIDMNKPPENGNQ